MDQVRQLQAENEQLKSQVANQSTVSPQAGPSNDPDASTSASVNIPTPAAAPVQTQFVYVPRERKCPRFSGKLSVDLITVEKWIEEARRCLAVRQMSQAEQILFLYDHLDGGAKAELDFHSPTHRDSSEKIFFILTENYSCSQSYVAAQLQFFQRSQREGESLRDYSHVLKSLMDVVIRKTPGGIPNSDQILRDQFVEHVHDDMLRRELKQRISQTPTLSFTVLRSIAIRWAEEGRNGSRQRARASSCNTYTNPGDRDVVESNAMTVPPHSDLAELKECLRKQQVQLDAIMKHIGILNTTSHTQIPQKEGRDSKPYRFQADGRPICLRCNKAGHIARFCRAQIHSAVGPTKNSGHQATVQMNDAVATSVWPQEN